MIFGWKRKKPTSDRSVTIGADNAGTIFTGDIEQLVIMNGGAPSSAAASAGTAVPSNDDLHRIARDLLTAGTPASLLHLVPDATQQIRTAISDFSSIPRLLEDLRSSETVSIAELASNDELHHLFTAPPGSGKTHALWQAANSILSAGTDYPLFVPIGHMESWSEVCTAISQVGNGFAVDKLIRDDRVCLMLDGWSEFAQEAIEERSKAIRALSGTRVIANARQGMTSDSFFRVWSLQQLSVQVVQRVVQLALSDDTPADPALLELLRLPLALVLFVLLGGEDSTPGELLARFHEQLSRDIPDTFRDILAGAIASVELSNRKRSFDRLKSELRARAADVSAGESIRLLDRLGTMHNKLGSIVPVHDLYWSWLVGVGLIQERRVEDSFPLLTTRESYQLAIQSGIAPTSQMVEVACNTDIILAATLLSALPTSDDAHFKIYERLSEKFEDPRIAVRLRAALAALSLQDAELFRQSLNVISEITAHRIYAPEIEATLDSAQLYEHRSTIAREIRATNSEIIFGSIAKLGDHAWIPWLEQLVDSQHIDTSSVVACALACTDRIPEWTRRHLPPLVKDASWKLRSISSRAKNVEFAQWLAERYDEFITAPSSLFIHVNDVLVACGDDKVFETLLAKFPQMTKNGQDTIGFAIVKKGEPWIGKFQTLAFQNGAAPQHHKLMEVVSLSIDDETARKWIAFGPVTLGWRVLVARHENKIIHEMLSSLPNSFDGVQDCPVLVGMSYLKNPPESLVDEITARIRGTMMPRTMEQIIGALVNMGPKGFGYLASLICRSPSAFPTYHLSRFLQFVVSWENEHDIRLTTSTPDGDVPFIDWIVDQRVEANKNEQMFHMALAKNAKLAIRIILTSLKNDPDIVLSIVRSMQPLDAYHSGFFDYLATTESLMDQVPRLFSRCFDSIPQEKLFRFVARPADQFHQFLSHLSSSPSSTHIELHKRIISHLLSSEFAWSAFRDTALILRAYTRPRLEEILRATVVGRSNAEIWLIRKIEVHRNELFINEQGEWLSTTTI